MTAFETRSNERGRHPHQGRGTRASGFPEEGLELARKRTTNMKNLNGAINEVLSQHVVLIQGNKMLIKEIQLLRESDSKTL